MSQKRLLALVGAFAIFASACGGPVASPSAPATSADPGASAPPASAEPSSALAAEQVLKIDLGLEPPAMDPNLAQDSVSISVLNALHRGLVYYDKDLVMAPALAETWDLSPDGQEFTFHLRDANYSNGEKIVAGDFVYSWKRLADPRTAAPYAYNMCDVAGVPEILGNACGSAFPDDPLKDPAALDAALDKMGVSAPDDKTFVVKLRRPAAYFLSIAGLWHSAPVQEKWITAANALEGGNYVSSGPFILDTWEHSSEIILKQNPEWWGPKPTLTEIRMSMIVEPAAGQAAYETDELDMFLTPAADIRRVKEDPVLGLEVLNSAQFGIGYYSFNNKEGPFANLNFRKAMVQSINKQDLIDVAWGGTGVVANSILPPGIVGHDPELNPYPYDLEAAKASFALAMTELGFASGADVPKLKFGYNTGSDHENRVAFLAEAWNKEFGLTFDQLGSEFGVFLTARHNLDFDVARNAWSQDYPHANNFLNDLFRCGGGNNDEGYCDPEYDKLIDAATLEADVTKQEAIYKEAQALLEDAAPHITLRWPTQAYTVKPWVSGLVVTPGDAQLPGDLFYETIQILEH